MNHSSLLLTATYMALLVVFTFHWSAAVFDQGPSEVAISAHENQQPTKAKIATFQVNVWEVVIECSRF